MHQNDDRLLSLTLAVTGHRDILPDETARIRAEFEQFIRRMASQVPGMTLKVLSGAATGADLLLTEAAMDLREEGLAIRPLVVLPMPEEDYLEDFAGDPEARSRLLHLKSRVPAGDWSHLPGAPERDRCYRNLADLLVNKADLVVAVWNGEDRMKTGGTADIVKRAASGQLHFTTGNGLPGRNLEMLDTVFKNPEKTSVFIIQANRQGDDAPIPVENLRSGYLNNSALVATLNRPKPQNRLLQDEDLHTKRDDSSRPLKDLLELITSTNRDLEKNPPTGDEYIGADIEAEEESAALSSLRRRFQQFDRLAQELQTRIKRIYTGTALLTLLLAFTFLFYAKLISHIGWLILHIAAFIAGLTAFRLLNPNRMKYRFALYRAAAESLRIEYFWMRAGVVSPTAGGSLATVIDTGNAAESNFISSVLKGATLPLPEVSSPVGGYSRLHTGWLEDQCRWYLQASNESSHRHHRYEAIVKASVFLPILLGVVLVTLYLVDSHTLYYKLPGGIKLKNVFTFLMGFIPICGVAAELMTRSNAYKELGRQYQLKHNYLAHLLEQLGDDPDETLWKPAVQQAGREMSMEHMEWLTTQKHREIEPAHGG